MNLKDEFRMMVRRLTSQYSIPPITDIFFPPFCKGGQPPEAEFMALSLAGDATGISYVLLPDKMQREYTALQPSDFIGQDPRGYALKFGDGNPIKEMISLAAINAICQHVMRTTNYAVDSATDSMGLLSVGAGDKLGMVGLFFPLINSVKKAGVDLIVIEKNEHLIRKYPELPITLDATKLSTCNKILCTSTTVLNNSLDGILAHCSGDAFVSVVGPTAGYFPDPLFARGVDVVGGRVVKDGARFLRALGAGERWGGATEKICFQKKTYSGVI